MLKLLGILAIVAMLEAHGHHHDEPKSSVFAEVLKHHHEDDAILISQLKSIKLTTPMVYACTTLAILSISLLPALLLCCIPVRNSNGQFLKFLLAFGAGGLLGDAVLHIIPHAMIGHQHNHGEHDHHHHHEEEGHSHEQGAHNHGAHDHSHQLTVGVYVIAGILTFMIFEQFTRIFRGANDHHHCHHHELQHLETRRTEHEQEPEEEEANDDTHKKEQTIKSSAYLNLVADFMHNITDGLAIGASFSINLYMGLLATFTVLIHELPHEIGDFAILVQSGFTKFQAIRLQFYTAFGALFGGYIAVWMGKNNEMHNLWMMPFTAGGFIYIATVSVIPEILEVNLQHSMKRKILYSILTILFFVSGVFMMYLVAKFE